MSTEGFNLGPSPNWYCTRISDCSVNGILAFGTRNYIVTVDVNIQPPVYKHFQVAHKERITSVVFSRWKDINALATGAEDGSVKIWDATKWTTEQELPTGACVGLKKINCLEWQHESAVSIADESGGILLWEFKKKVTTCLKHEVRSWPFVLSANPHDSSQLAVGYKGGLVAILDVAKQGQILYKLKGHDEDILALSWKPQLSLHNNSGNTTDLTLLETQQLASTSRDRTLRVWNVQQEKCCTTIQIPHSQRISKDEAKSRFWAVASWLPSSQREIMLTTFMGELLLVTLQADGKPQTQPFCVKQIGGHTRCIFNITVFQDLAFTVSLDRTIVIWNLKKKKSSYILPTLGGFAYSLAFSSIDVGRLAVGVGDEMIRVWNVSSAVSPYSCTSLWQGIKGKVICLSWHPEKENWLAYGTDGGRVGIADTIGNKMPIVSNTYHRNTVYSLSWGPCKNFADDKTKWFLYSCGDGKILIHNPSKPQSDALSLRKLLLSSQTKSNYQWSELAWKPDCTALAVGCEDGTVEVYTVDFVILVRLMAQNKLIQSLRWHPSCTTTNSEVSIYHTWLACASNELVIHVYDLKDIFANVGDTLHTSNEEEPCIMMQSCRQMNVHRLRVTSLSWSPHQEGRLASSSYDSSVQIWDVITGTPTANYRGHLGRVFCVEWSPLNPDVIFSGSEDFTVQQFCVSKVQNRFPIPAKKEKRNRKKKFESSVAVSQEFSDQSLLSEELEELLLQKKMELQKTISVEIAEETVTANKSDATQAVPSEEICNFDAIQVTNSVMDSNHAGDSDIKIEEVNARLNSVSLVDSQLSEVPVQQPKQSKSGTTASRKKRRAGKAMFPLVSSLDNRGKSYSLDDCRYLVDNADSGEHTELSDHHNLGFFMDHEAFLELLDREGNHHREEDNLEYALQMKVWTGDVGEALREADEKGQLDDWLVSLAPLASRSLWLEMCEKYSRQLVSDGMHHKAALYLIACHKIYEAVNMLKEQGLYREAVSIAKSRLPASDPMLQQLMLDWVSKLEKEGNYEMAAKCYLSQSRHSQAAKTLAKRNNPESYRTAAYIMAKEGKVVESEGYAMSCIRSSLIKNDWDTAEKMVDEQVGLNVLVDVGTLHLLISLHNKLSTFLEDAKQIEKPTPLNEILVQKKKCDIHLWKGYFSTDMWAFFDIVDELWVENKFLPPNADLKLQQDCCQFLSKLNACKQQAVTSKEMIYQLAVEVTIQKLKSDFNLSKCLNAAYKLELGFFHNVCHVIFPLDHFWIEQDSATVETCSKAVTLYQSFTGVTVPSWLSHVLTERSKAVIRSSKVEERSLPEKDKLPINAFYSIALLKSLKDELKDFVVITHFENDETECSSLDCEATEEILTMLITILASHLLNPSFDEETCLKHELDAADILANTVAKHKTILPKSDTTENGSSTEISDKKLEGFQKFCEETNNSPFPQPVNGALECLELCEGILLKVKCNLIEAKLKQIMLAIHKWLESFQEL